MMLPKSLLSEFRSRKLGPVTALSFLRYYYSSFADRVRGYDE